MRNKELQPLQVDKESLMDLAFQSDKVHTRTQLDLVIEQASEIINFQNSIPSGMMLLGGTGPQWTKLQERLFEEYGDAETMGEVLNEISNIRNVMATFGALKEYIGSDEAEVQMIYYITNDLGKQVKYVETEMMGYDKLSKLISVSSDLWINPCFLGFNVLVGKGNDTAKLFTIRSVREEKSKINVSLNCTILHLEKE